ncbi:hypothetical protein FCL40_04570 [Ferrimonas sediminicola]|uniref:Uncharacterized protein n=1 Tax=Ferrimonas sediminicola TaxID=2569538 RepID=A0A4U1BHB0_9GAMM|nr:hypothetical protein [Ferrimonas sediminicola]TKB50434.1 hypothetical protein FCL40_04570 [Ferrimonas sediminicola]
MNVIDTQTLSTLGSDRVTVNNRVVVFGQPDGGKFTLCKRFCEAGAIPLRFLDAVLSYQLPAGHQADGNGPVRSAAKSPKLANPATMPRAVAIGVVNPTEASVRRSEISCGPVAQAAAN